MYKHIKVPAGEKITVNPDFSINVPNNPIIPFIEGDGTGMDITPVMIKVVDAAVEKAYGGSARSPGWRSMRVRNQPRFMVQMFGCPMRPLMRLKSMLYPLKAR